MAQPVNPTLAEVEAVLGHYSQRLSLEEICHLINVPFWRKATVHNRLERLMETGRVTRVYELRTPGENYKVYRYYRVLGGTSE
jgi:predicted transcriptional regulator